MAIEPRITGIGPSLIEVREVVVVLLHCHVRSPHRASSVCAASHTHLPGDLIRMVQLAVACLVQPREDLHQLFHILLLEHDRKSDGSAAGRRISGDGYEGYAERSGARGSHSPYNRQS